MGFLDFLPLIGDVVGGIFGSANQSSTNNANIAMNAATNQTNLKIADRNNAARQKLAEQANAWNLDQWLREVQNNDRLVQGERDYQDRVRAEQNDWNSAQSQMARFQSAGLNPYMFSPSGASAGSGGSSTLSTSPRGSSAAMADLQNPAPMTPARVQPLDFSFISKALHDLPMSLEQLKGVREDNKGKSIDNVTRGVENLERIKNLKADTLDKSMRADLNDAERAITDQLRHFRSATWSDDVSLHKWDSLGRELQNEYLQHQIVMTKLNNAITEVNLQWLPEEKRVAIANTISQTMLNDANRYKSYEEAVTEASKRLMYDANTALSKAEKAYTYTKNIGQGLENRKNNLTEGQAERLIEATVSKAEWDAIVSLNTSETSNWRNWAEIGGSVIGSAAGSIGTYLLLKGKKVPSVRGFRK